MKRLTLLLTLLCVGCTPKTKPSTPPAPPPIHEAKPKAHKDEKPREGDQMVHGCIVVKLGELYSDCLCRKPSVKIDAISGEQSLECHATPPTKIKPKGKHK